VNQRHLTLGEQLDARAELEGSLTGLAGVVPSTAANSLMARLGAAHRRMLGLSKAEASIVSGLLSALQASQMSWQVPRLDDEVNDLAGLARVGSYLFRPR
jgi:hypothetical protein